MSERSKLISRLLSERDYRAAYIRAKLDVLIPSQLHALRLREDMTQPVLAEEAGMLQARISAMESPGKVNFNRETLVRMAATFRVGLLVKFVPFSEMLRWENEFGQDTFNVTKLDNDVEFLQPAARAVHVRRRVRRNRSPRHPSAVEKTPQIPVGAQMRFPFEPPISQTKADVIRFPSKSGSTHNLPVMRAAVGAGGNYGNR